MSKRINLTLDDTDATLLLQLAGSERKQSEFIAALLRAANENRIAQQGDIDLNALRFQVGGQGAYIEQLRRELENVRYKLDETERTLTAKYSELSSKLGKLWG